MNFLFKTSFAFFKVLATSSGKFSLTYFRSLSETFKYKFSLKPIYVIANVRKNSPAAISGLQKEDVIVSINGKPGYEYTLERINALLKSEDEDWITFEVERESQIMKFKFQLLNVL